MAASFWNLPGNNQTDYYIHSIFLRSYVRRPTHTSGRFNSKTTAFSQRRLSKEDILP
jgi:hypothetical protein